MRPSTEMQEAICPACRAQRSHALGPKHDYLLRGCDVCGSIFATVDGVEAVVSELYDRYYDGSRFDLPSAAARSLERLVQTCEPFRSTDRWLDIGYGEGGLLRIVESHGWKCYGTELSPQALDFGRGRGWSVAAEPDGNREFPVGGFDVVTMIEFIEHALNPREVLALASRLLRPGGLLYLTTPNAGSLNRRFLGLEWSVIAPPEHVTIWSVSGMKTALGAAGLTVQRVRTEGLNPGEMAAKLRQRRASQNGDAAPTPSRNDTAFALNQAMTASPARRLLKQGINHTLSVLGIGDTLKAWAVKGPVAR